MTPVCRWLFCLSVDDKKANSGSSSSWKLKEKRRVVIPQQLTVISRDEHGGYGHEAKVSVNSEFLALGIVI